MKREQMIIEPKELIERIGNPNLRIYDTTVKFFAEEGEPTAYEDYLLGHIPNAAFFDHKAFSDSESDYMYMLLPEQELAEQIGNLGISPESEVIVYASDLIACATRAWWMLRYAGHNNVRVLNGGLSGWKAAGGELEQGDYRYNPATFVPNLRPEMYVDKDEVFNAMNNTAVCTVNALNQEAYDKSRIRGSMLQPIAGLVNDMAAFKSDEEMAAQLRDEANHERIITYCGGGFAATTNAMAHLMAGNQNVAVYDGSMSEWAGEGMPMDRSETAV